MPRPDVSTYAYMFRRAATFADLPPRMRKRHVRRQRGKATRLHRQFWAALIATQGRVCQACGSTENLTLDHVLPVSRGGRSVIENMQVLCEFCNRLKNRDIVDCREVK